MKTKLSVYDIKYLPITEQGRRVSFFVVDAQLLIAAMKLTRGKNLTPIHDIAKEGEGVRAIEKAA